VIDLHSHILPGIDDGARSLDEARDLARQAAAEGVTTIAATPHVRSDYPTTAEQMESGVAAVRAELTRAGIPVEVVHGGELSLQLLGELTEDDLRRFSFGQMGRYVLLECPYFGSPLELVPAIKALLAGGLTPLLAHPERNREVQANAALVEAATRVGALVQVTAASLDGTLGRQVRRTCERLLELELVHVLASDAHAPATRTGLSAAAASLRDEGLARYLTHDVAAAIIAGEEIPPSGAARRHRAQRLSRWWR
jgi:protein-tyrosine phosphatase